MDLASEKTSVTDNVRLGCALETFCEKEDALRLITTLRTNELTNSEAEVSYEKFLLIFDQYQEQPHLLDPTLDQLLESLISIVRQHEEFSEYVIIQAFKYLYVITKVRGHKTVVKHLPHEVSDLEPLLSYLDGQDPNDASKWEVRYFLLLWLSIIVMIPFNLTRFDHSDAQGKKSTIERYCDYIIIPSSNDCLHTSSDRQLLSQILSSPMELARIPCSLLIEFLPNGVGGITVNDRFRDNIPKSQTFDVWPSVRIERVYRHSIQYILSMVGVLTKVFSNVLAATHELNTLPATQCDKCRDAAALVVAKFLSRPDVKQKHLPQFIDWCLQKIVLDKEQGVLLLSQTGTLSALAQLFKHGKREDVLSYANSVLKIILKSDLNKHKSTAIRKLSFKLIQRLGMTFLKVKISAWRYSRGSRSLIMNLTSNQIPHETQKSVANGVQPVNNVDDDDDDDIPEQIEDVIEVLINGLKDPDTIIRWSAAKGIGRITGKLPKDYADEVIESIMQLFSLRENDSSWHGACLSLAELGRRGLLLPGRLPEVVPVILKALVYDEQRGNFSVGAHIRDAACYVCWSFARAYEPQELKPFVQSIAGALIVVSVFDREVNCRRAASAAFQENVGRQGTFPHGIDILTTVDYFAVGNRVSSYLKLSKFIAQYVEYKVTLIEHLLSLKVNHWDKEIRELTASALAELTPAKPDYIISTVVPELIRLSTGFDLFTRHGAIVSLAKVIHALAVETAEVQAIDVTLGDEITREIEDIPKILNSKNMYRGMGGELMRLATCTLIEMLSRSHFPLALDTRSSWMRILDENLEHISIDIQDTALSALPEFYCQYFEYSDENSVESTVNRYMAAIDSSDQNVRIGCCRALGVLPKFMVTIAKNKILKKIESCCNDKDSVELRRYAISSLSNFCQNLTVSHLDETIILSVYRYLLKGLEDYTLDSRGDTGSWVRDEAMRAIQEVTNLVIKENVNLICEEVYEAIFVNLAKQAVEKIDKVRALAGSIFCSLLYSTPALPHIPNFECVKKIFPEEEVKGQINWSNPSDTFHRFTKLLQFPKFKHSVLLGLVVSMGGVTESVVKSSSSSLSNFITSVKKNTEEMQSICQILLKIIDDNKHNNRITVPYFSTLDQILSDGLITPEDVGDDFFIQLTSSCKKELLGCTDPVKLMSSIDLFCTLVQFSVSRRASLSFLAVLLCHRYPRVRLDVASKLYDALLTHDWFEQVEDGEQVLTIMSDTDWNDSIELLRPVRDEICDILDVPKPVKRVKKI